jgi:hypothetical protein
MLDAQRGIKQQCTKRFVDLVKGVEPCHGSKV